MVVFQRALVSPSISLYWGNISLYWDSSCGQLQMIVWSHREDRDVTYRKHCLGGHAVDGVFTFLGNRSIPKMWDNVSTMLFGNNVDLSFLFQLSIHVVSHAHRGSLPRCSESLISPRICHSAVQNIVFDYALFAVRWLSKQFGCSYRDLEIRNSFELQELKGFACW